MEQTLQLDAKTTALVVIDLETAIVSRPGLGPHAPKDVVANAVRIADALRSAGGTVAWVHVLLHDTLDLPADQPTRPPGSPKPPPDASELVPDVTVRPGDVRVGKRQWGAFYGTNLEQDLRRRGIKTIVMAGIATNMGVESTARAAFDRGYALVFAEDAMTSMAELHAFAVEKVFPKMGRVRSTEQIVAAL